MVKTEEGKMLQKQKNRIISISNEEKKEMKNNLIQFVLLRI